MKIRLNAGREFNLHDRSQSQRVAIINEEMAAQWWPRENAVGSQFSVALDDGSTTPVQVIGVARNAKYSSIWEQPARYLYLPVRQMGLPLAASQLVIRTKVVDLRIVCRFADRGVTPIPGDANSKSSGKDEQ
ncbi:MAG TPA: ABC transporter permease [Bryobacteraceae bacterium]|nr:ABC transporter permease [Bryobacteraceae bacterium]